MIKHVFAVAILLASFSSYTATAQQAHGAIAKHTSKAVLTEDQKIEQLITSLREMKGASFIRNGSEHTSQEAADHLESKWKKHSDQVKTAEDFIKYLATKSSMTGEKYMIRFSNGKQVPAATVLYERLNQLNTPHHK